MSQGKAKKKLHYHQAEDKSNSQIQIKEVFTLHDIDTLFDDIDADSELRLPMLSPLPKSSGVNDQKKSGGSCDSYDIKAPSEQAPKHNLIEANGIHDDEIIDKESPFKEIVPIKTSSPISLATEGEEAVDGVRPMADPLLFGEDEEPIGGDPGKPPCTQQAIRSYSESLESPPERLEFRKVTKPNAGSSSSMKTAKTSTTSVQATQSTPLEIKEDSPMDKDPSRLSHALVQKNEQKLQGAEQCMDQMVEDTGKRSSFQHKLKKALMPKSSRKPATVPAPLLVDLEEDFMILDDEAPILFVIPRKTDVSKNKKTVPAKTSKESLPAEPLSQTEADVNDQQRMTSKISKAQTESGKKQPKGNRGKASKKKGIDAVVDVLEKRTNSVLEVQDEGVGEQISSQNVPGLKDVDSSVVTGEQSSKDNAPDELPDRGEEDTDSPHILAPPVVRITKKSSKPSGSQQERPGSKAKKESKKVKSTIGPHSTNKNRKNSRKGEPVSKTNKGMSKRQVEPEQIDAVCEEDDSVELPPAYQEEEQVVNKQSSNKQEALKVPKKDKTKQIEPTPKDPPPVASDSSMMNKRTRKPPGSWWLSGQDASATQWESEETGGTTQGPKTKKTPSKQAAVEVSEEAHSAQSSKPAQKSQKRKSSSTFNMVENAKKVLTAGDDAKAEQKTAKKSGGRKKIKAAAQPQVSSPTRVSEEEVGATSEVPAEDISPVFCAHRQHNPTPGEKQLFDNVYTRDNGSAKKRPSSSLRRPESSSPDVPWKRQRRAPSNWWEVAQSQEPTDGPLSPHSPAPQKSEPTNTHIPAALHIEPNPAKSLKTKNHTRNVQRNIISTPKSIKTSLASMNAIFASDKVNVVKSGQRRRKQGRRNILHSLEDQSDHSSENMAHSDDQMQRNRHVASRFVAVKPSGNKTQTSVRVSSGPNTLSDVDVAFRSGPSSMIELQHHDEEDDDIDLPSTRLTPRVQHVPRVLSQCDLCGPPLLTIVLEEEDWKNLKAWFSHLWPPASKEGRVISPDDFHWHSYGGRAMGHVVDLQSTSFSHGKILLGSFMKKPPQMDLETVSVFSIISSCVRVEIDDVKSVYNSGEVFMIPSGRVYSIHNLCQEPAVLIYHRTQSDHTQC
ncbi:proteoglycan 4 isoform X2 [Triplophysa rosa]|uniref:proteoglycan 4 isoform X2 n=1 Tax=Triplophysa rosa TaxID=992332 RepID=UPI002546373F|nr:proteoglycan 4 isoform X2 [Triplophysa rosa]